MSKKTILAVDDEEDILELLEYNLSNEGFDVLCVSSGEEAIEAVRSKLPDLMILDLMLPGIDGLEVCRILPESEILNPAVMSWARIWAIASAMGLSSALMITLKCEHPLGGSHGARRGNGVFREFPSGFGIHVRGHPAGIGGVRSKSGNLRNAVPGVAA